MRLPTTSPVCTSGKALLVALALLATSRPVDAQWLNCVTIRPGDTAARVATRMTGGSQYRHSARFQIVNPGSRRIIAKSQYDRIQAGWQACVELRPVGGDPRDVLATSSSAVNAAGGQNGAALAIRDTGLVLVLGIGLAVAPVLVWIAFRAYSDRQRTLELMSGFGNRFVCEFERPLMQPVPDPRRIRSRLRARPERKRLDILLAPAGKGRYPNLSDHKDNVMYDVVRVVQILEDQAFAYGPPYTEGDWVVVPFQFKGWSKQAGAK